MEDLPIQLLEVVTGTAVEAVLRARLPVEVVVATEALWKPFRQAIPGAEHSHWDWALKTGRLVLPGTRIMGVECRGVIEGMMMVFERGYYSRLQPAVGQPLVYVDFLETAPWNLRTFSPGARFRRAGVRLMAAAARLSESLGYEGRVGLRSLPQSEDFYVRACRMSALGPDRGYDRLWYFEWAADAACLFAEGAGR